MNDQPPPILSPEGSLRAQLMGLRRYDPEAWKRYDFNDLRQRAVVEELLRQPMIKKKVPGR